jgi:hypothetical protein
LQNANIELTIGTGSSHASHSIVIPPREARLTPFRIIAACLTPLKGPVMVIVGPISIAPTDIESAPVTVRLPANEGDEVGEKARADTYHRFRIRVLACSDLFQQAMTM